MGLIATEAVAQAPGKGYLGFYTRSNSNVLAAENAFSGVTVTRVIENAPGEAAGLKEGDIILAVNGAVVSDPNQLVALAESLPVGSVLRLKTERDREVIEREVRTVARIESSDAAPVEARTWIENKRLGVEVGTPDASRAEDFGLKPGEGVMVLNVASKGPLAKAGIKPGMMITAVNGEAVHSGPGFLERISADSKARSIVLGWRAAGERERTRRIRFHEAPSKTRELKIPLIVNYTRKENTSKLSLPLLFLYSRERLEGATKHSLLYFIRFERGRSEELLEVTE